MKRIIGGALLYPVCIALGCSSNTGGGTPPGQTTGNVGANGGAGNSTSGNGGSGNGFGFFSGGTSGASTSAPDPDAATTCASDTVPAQLTQVNILFLLDKSGSMGDDPNGQWANAATRWNPVVETLDAFFTSPTSTGIYASLSFLPADGGNTTICNVASYESGTASIKVPLTQLTTAGSQLFLKRLCDPTQPLAATCIVPAGGTPTRPALQGTIDYAATIQQKYPQSKTVIVFLTDGEPGFGYVPAGSSTAILLNSCDDLTATNGCIATIGTTYPGPPCVQASDEVTKVAAVIASAPPNSIYLFGVGDLTTGTMDQWAAASGNPAVALQGLNGADAAAALKSALDSIRTTYLNCNIPIPTSKTGAPVDPSKVNVNYINGSGTTTALGRSDGCSSVKPSWQYDSPTSPTQIQLCPTACSTAQQDPNGKVQVVLGCSTIIN